MVQLYTYNCLVTTYHAKTEYVKGAGFALVKPLTYYVRRGIFSIFRPKITIF